MATIHLAMLVAVEGFVQAGTTDWDAVNGTKQSLKGLEQISGNTLIHFLAECLMRRSISLSRLNRKYLSGPAACQLSLA